MHNESVAKKIGKIIMKNNLPEGTPQEIQNKITAKSMRSGGINTLCKAPINVNIACHKSHWPFYGNQHG